MKRRRRRSPRQKRTPVQEVAWRTAATTLGGEYEATRTGPGQVRLRHGPWPLLLSQLVVQVGTAPVVVTRARAVVHRRDGARLTMSRTGSLVLALRRILPGGPSAGGSRRENVSVRSNRPGTTLALGRDDRLTELVVRLDVTLKLSGAGWKERRAWGKEAGHLTVDALGPVLDADRLCGMVDLIRSALDRLAGLGVLDASRAPEG